MQASFVRMIDTFSCMNIFTIFFFTKNSNKLCFFCNFAKQQNITFKSMVGSLMFWEQSVFSCKEIIQKDVGSLVFDDLLV